MSAIQQRVYLQFVSSSFFQGWRWWMCGELSIDGDKEKVFLLISFHYYLIKDLYILLIVWISNWKSINWCWIYWWGFFYDKNFFHCKVSFYKYMLENILNFTFPHSKYFYTSDCFSVFNFLYGQGNKVLPQFLFCSAFRCFYPMALM